MHRLLPSILLAGLVAAPAAPALAAPIQAPPAPASTATRANTYSVDAITVSAPWSRATFGPGSTGIAFMTIDNAGAADALTGASCTGARTASLHDEKSGTMTMPGMTPMRTDSMPELDQIAIPARGHVVLRPGGMHVMLQDTAAALTVGQSVPCVLQFQHAGALPIALRVGPAGASSPSR